MDLMTSISLAKEEQGIILDTTVFNGLLKEEFSIGDLYRAIVNIIPANTSFKLYASQIQQEELKKTKKPLIKHALLCKFSDINPDNIAPILTIDLPGAGWEQGKLANSDQANLFKTLMIELKAIDLKNRNKKKKDINYINLSADVNILITAIENNFILITLDMGLVELARKYEVNVVSNFEKVRE